MKMKRIRWGVALLTAGSIVLAQKVCHSPKTLKDHHEKTAMQKDSTFAVRQDSSESAKDSIKPKKDSIKVEKGRASFYSARLRKARTASGEPHHADSLVCAHKKHPFGTLLRVYNPKNGKEVIVKVTDRGPFRKGFIVDLSYSAAKQIGIVRAGHMPVEVSVVGFSPLNIRKP